MKKLLNISVIAALAILPLAANATVVAGDPVNINTETPDGQTEQSVTASAGPKYQLAEANPSVDGVVATAGYVKGAYNAAIKAINKVSETADSAVKSVITGTANGTIAVNNADVAVKGLDTAAYAKATDFISSAAGSVKTANIDAGQVTKEKLEATVQSSLNAADSAANKDLSNLSTDGQAHIVTAVTNNAASGAYSSSENYDSNTVGAAIKTLEGKAGDYATKTGVETTVTNAFTGARATITNANLTKGNAVTSATVPVVTTWGATEQAATGVSVNLTQAEVVTNVSGTAAVTSETVDYPED